MPSDLARHRSDNGPGCGEIILVHHHPYRDEELAAIGDARIAIKGDGGDILRFEPSDQDMRFVAIKPAKLDKRHRLKP